MKSLVLGCIVSVVLVSAVAQADLPSTCNGGPAIVISDEGCTLPDATGNMFFAEGAKFTAVQNGEWIIMTCHGQLPSTTDSPEVTVRLNGATYGGRCQTPFGSTPHWRAVVQKNGKVLLVCKYTRIPNG
jgi:hypothetical protein